MRKRILAVLLIINSILLLIHYFPLAHIYFDNEAAAIGIIGGADGPTAIYIASNIITWIPMLLIALEVILIVSLVIVHKKNRPK